MALTSLKGQVSDLCIGKPELKWITANTSISDALAALKASGESCLSVWACSASDSCVCVGKFCTADAILFLCRDENLADPFGALQTPIYDILPKGAPIVRHIEPNSSVLEAINYILEGTQNLVIPIQNRRSNNTCRHECCWLTHEDVVRFLLNSIGAFSPVPTVTIDSLNVIDPDIMTITYNKPASSALPYLNRAITEQKSIAVVDEENRVIGEISPLSLAYCDETAAAAILTLSAMDMLNYIDCSSPAESLVSLVKTRLEEMNLSKMVDFVDEFTHPSLMSFSSSSSLSCSSDDESLSSRGKGSSRHYSGSRCEPIICSGGSSLLAVMIQAIAHRVTCVWVVDDDHTVVGTVTFAGILNVFRSVASNNNL